MTRLVSHSRSRDGLSLVSSQLPSEAEREASATARKPASTVPNSTASATAHQLGIGQSGDAERRGREGSGRRSGLVRRGRGVVRSVK